MTDQDLVQRARKGDEAAFLLVYERNRNAVFQFAYRLTGTVETAEDLTQECFLAVISGTARFDASRGALRTYLLGVVRNLAFRQHRESGRECGEDDLPDAPSPETQLDDLLAGEVSARVERAVSELPLLQREALVLFQYDELSLEEIASVVGTEVGTVKARLHRARERLRNRLAPMLADTMAQRNCI